MKGWKTWTGALFLALTAALNQLQPVVPGEIWQVLQAITGFLGAGLTAVGIGHKIEKAGK